MLFLNIKFLIRLFFCFLIFKVKSDNNYISLKVIKADDCIRNITILNELFFQFTKNKDGDCKSNSFGDCDANDFNNVKPYPEDKLLVKYYKYNYKVKILVKLEDYNHIDGYLDMTVYFNEYIIKTSDNTNFWKCLDCGNGAQNYFFHSNRMNYYQDKGDGGCQPHYYTFIFSVNKLEELYKYNFEVNHEFYSFTSKEIFYLNISYLDNEVELINFNIPEYFHITEYNYRDLEVEYENYYFKIEYNNNFKGNLIGLNASTSSKEIIKNGNSFKVTDDIGLNYELTKEEKEALSRLYNRKSN